MKRILTLTGLLILSAYLDAAADSNVFVVTYRSLELVYINGGRDDGLAIGDRGEVRRDDQVVAELEVAFLAGHSASCHIITQQFDIALGDSVYVNFSEKLPRVNSMQDSIPLSNVERSERFDQNSKTSRARPRIDGNVGLRVSHWNDARETDLDNTHADVTFNATIRNLWENRLTVSARSRSRYSRRNSTNADEPAYDEWDHNIYEVALAYGTADSPFALTLGRISPRRAGGIGRMDGILIEERLSRVRFGAFTGVEPQWQYNSREDALRKYGGYFNFEIGNRRERALEHTLAIVAEYHASTVSREYLHSQGRFNIGNRLNVSHTLEFDINRGWRRDQAGESMSLSSVYAFARYQVAPWVAMSVNFDNRQNYWSYAVRDLADSLFDNNLRQGWRGQLDFRLPLRINVQMGAGLRDRGNGSDATRTYRSSVRQSGVLLRGLSIYAAASRFDNNGDRGDNVSISISQSLMRQTTIGLSVAQYNYTIQSEDVSRENRRYELSLRFPIFSRLRFNGQYQRHVGSDTFGHRFDSSILWQF